MTLNGHSVDFTKGFTDLHTKSYGRNTCRGAVSAWKMLKATVSLCESIRLGHNLGEILRKMNVPIFRPECVCHGSV